MQACQLSLSVILLIQCHLCSHLKLLYILVFIVKDMERAIARDLVSHVLLFSEHLLKAVKFTAELDW